MMKKINAKKWRRYQTGKKDIDKAIHKLVEMAGGSPDAEFLEEIIVTSLKMREDEMERGDIKMINAAMKELRYALKVFYNYRHVRKVAMFGSARTPKKSREYKQAHDFAKAMVDAGWMVITGGATGIMHAGNEGAGSENSFGVNIRLPFEQEANPVIAKDPKLINFKYFFTRKLTFIRESDATVLFPGGFGTHDEGFETLTLIQTGKTSPRPVVCLDPPGSSYWKAWMNYVKNHLAKSKLIDAEDLSLIYITQKIEDAVNYIAGFYRNYHSMRYVADRLVLRIKKPLMSKSLTALNDRFDDILVKGKIRQMSKPLTEESNEPHTYDLVRLVMHFDRRSYGRLKQMIDVINKQ